MNTYKIKAAVAALFIIAAGHAAAQSTTSGSQSGADSNSSSVGIGQGGGSSLNQVSTTSSSNTKSTSVSVGGIATANGGNASSSLRNSGNSASTSAVRGSGNSNVTVSVDLASAAGTGTAGTGTGTNGSAVSKDAVGDPGSSPYNTNARVEYSGTQTVKTNPAIQAPGLTTTLSDTCMGSLSVGISLPGFGATGGSTIVDQACVRRLDAREFRAMGLTDVALALLCQSDSNRRAVESTGHLCPGTTHPLAKVKGDDNNINTGTVADDENFRDPIVRARMGLPALAEAYPYQPAPAKAPTLVQPAAPITPAPAPVKAAPQVAQEENVQVSKVGTVDTQVAAIR